MKNIIILFLFCLNFINIFAQSNIKMNFDSLMGSFYEPLDKSQINTGFLLDKGFLFSESSADTLTGNSTIPITATLFSWKYLYNGIKRACVDKDIILPALDEIIQYTRKHITNNIII